MAYNRLWFNKDLFALTLGGGAINNPGRYLVLIPPINGATAVLWARRTSRPAPGDPYKAWDASVTFDYMPSQFITFRIEGNHRAANVPYFSGEGGVTAAGRQLSPRLDRWCPDGRRISARRRTGMTAAMLVKF